MSGEQTISRRVNYKLILGVIVTLACLAYSLRGVPLEQVTGSFCGADYLTLPPLLLLLFVFYWLKAVRWRLLLEPVRVLSTRDVAPAMLVGFAFNNILIAHLGELVRVFVLGRQFGLPKTAVLSSVVLERVFDIIAILFLFAAGLFAVPGLPDGFRTLAVIAAVVLVPLILVLLAYVLFTEFFVRVVETLLSRVDFLPENMRAKAAGILESGAHGLASIKNVRLMSGIIIASLLQWIVNGVMIYEALLAFDVLVTVYAALIVLGVTAFGVTIPSTPGYFGIIQASFVLSLEPFGADQADVFASSIYYQISAWIPITAIGLWCFYRSGLHMSDVKREIHEPG